MTQKQLVLLSLAMFSLHFSACSVLPPSQEMSDVRQLLQAAELLQANDYAPFSMNHARDHLVQAREQLEKGRHAYGYARFHANSAKHAVREAHKISIAFHYLEKGIQQATQLGTLWLHTEDLVRQARDYARQGAIELCFKSLAKADGQVQQSLNQHKLEQLRLGMQPNSPLDISLTATQIELYHSFERKTLSFERWLQNIGINDTMPLYFDD